MPRKKSEKPINSSAMSQTPHIVNWYDKIPKEMLDDADNPNFHIHHLKIPFRMLSSHRRAQENLTFLLI